MRVEAQSLAAWLGDLVPSSIVKAAADGSLVPVIVFAGLFGVALSFADREPRDSVLRVVEGVAEAMQRIVAWILVAAPVGVFALAVPLAFRLGLAAAGAVVAYVVLVVVLTVAAVALLVYPVGILAGPLGARAFVAVCAPVQSIAFASRSSLATLPVIVDSAERAGLTSDGARFVLPLAAALFHFGAAVAQPAGALFLARLYGVELTSAQLGVVVMAVLVASFAAPGVPGGSIIAMVPVLMAVNLPVEGIGILLAVDTIPDMFRTLANATGAMMLTIVAHAGADADQAGAPARTPP
jgi:Na+/H+-dicarboxylate symporter